ncbi:WG repeat-containing protein [Clostridiaceae bacterium M8S5]|nr:WG repeat-containing protein [Clostridiaceae bacterium M8S5]
MKKIIAFGLSVVIASNILGCQAVEGVRNESNKISNQANNEVTMFRNEPKKISKDILNELKFIDKHSYNGVSLRIQKFADRNGLVPFALHNPEKKIEHYGFINNKDGGYILPTFDYIQFNKINFFENGLEPVKKGGKYGYINIKGEKVIDHNFEEARVFQSGLAAVKKNGMWGYIDRKGNMVISPQFKDAILFIGGVDVAEVTTKDNKKALINKQGDILLQCDGLMSLSIGNIYTEKKDCIYFSATKNNKSALVKVEKGRMKQLTDYIYTTIYYDDGKFGYEKQSSDYMHKRGTLDLEGKETKEEHNPNGLRYVKVSNGRFIVTNMDGLCGIADENKKMIISPKFLHIDPFVSKYYAIVQTKDMRQGIIDREGNFIIKPDNLRIQRVENKEDFIIVGEEGNPKSKVQLYDVKRKKYIGGKYIDIHPMNDDFIVAVNDRKRGLMNKNGEIIIKPYDDYRYEEHKKGYIVKNNEKGKYITNLAGKKTSDEIYQAVYNIDENNYRVVRKNLKYGLADKDGNLLIPCINEMIKVVDKSKAQIVLKNGDEVIIGTVEIPNK